MNIKSEYLRNKSCEVHVCKYLDEDLYDFESECRKYLDIEKILNDNIDEYLKSYGSILKN